jgi:RNA polymerase sigma-70 factor (ECF subfamily)
VSPADKTGLDARVAAHCTERDYQSAATAILSELGPDVIKVIHARVRDEQITAEVFSHFAEGLWRGLPDFAFRCSVRAWVFTLARNAGSRHLEREVRRQRAHIPLSRVPALAAQLRSLHSETAAHLRSENRDLVARAKEQLDEADQLLLTLRIDRRLPFRDIALVMLERVDSEPALVTREAARLRKRFQLLKERLRELLRDARGGP